MMEMLSAKVSQKVRKHSLGIDANDEPREYGNISKPAKSGDAPLTDYSLEPEYIIQLYKRGGVPGNRVLNRMCQH